MSVPRDYGGQTQDEIMAISLFKLGLRTSDTVLEIGCGTGKISLAAAQRSGRVISIDRRPEAVSGARNAAEKAGIETIEFFCSDAIEFLAADRIYDCAFVGGTQHLEEVLPLLAAKVRRTIVINAVLLSTLATTVATMQRLGIFSEAVQVQVSRSHDIAGSIMFRPIDPVFVIVGRGMAC